MPGTVTSITPRRAERRRAAAAARRPFRDNPRLILAGIAVLVAVLVAMLVAANRVRLAPGLSHRIRPLRAHRRRPHDARRRWRSCSRATSSSSSSSGAARCRSRASARSSSRVLIGMTLVPAVLVLLVGSELIARASSAGSTRRWTRSCRPPTRSPATTTGSGSCSSRDHASRIADVARGASICRRRTCGALARLDRAGSGVASRRRWSRSTASSRDAGARRLEPVVDVAAPTLPARLHRARRRSPRRRRRSRGRRHARDRTARRRRRAAARGGRDSRAATAGRSASWSRPITYRRLAARSRRMTQAYENYSQLRVLKRPLTGVYLSFFLMVTLMILVGATWMGSYLAKRITRPVQRARRGGARNRRRPSRSARRAAEQRRVRLAGRSVQRDGRRSSRRAGGASSGRRSSSSASTSRSKSAGATSRRFSSASRPASSRSTPTGASRRINSAASRLLDARPRRRRPAVASVFDRADLQPLGALLVGAGSGEGRAGRRRKSRCCATARNCSSPSSRRRSRATAATPDGPVLVLDDVTPLIRAQKVAAWRDVARRLAHEIKNPLTPIQLSAERMRRHFAGAAGADARAGRRVHRDDRRRGRVAEGAGRRVLAVRAHAVAADGADRPRRAHRRHAGALRRHLRGRRDRRGGSRRTLPLVRLDAEQIRRVIINLVDNAIEAMERKGDDRRRDAAIDATQQASCASSSPTTARAFRRPSAKSCSCRTIRPSAAAAASGSPSSGASSPSTAAASKSATTRRTARGLPSSCRVEAAPERLMNHHPRSSTTNRACAARWAACCATKATPSKPSASGEACLERVTRGGGRPDRARRVAAGHGRPGDARAAARAPGRRAGRDHLGPRQHRVGGRARSRWARSTSSRSRCRSTRPCWSSRNALRQRRLEAENRALRARVDRPHTMVGESHGDPPAARAGRDGGADQRPRADLRRERHRQGTGRARHACAEPPAVRPVRRGELRGNSRRADRERAVRPRAGRVHGRGRRPPRQVRSSRTAARSSSTKSAT